MIDVDGSRVEMGRHCSDSSLRGVVSKLDSFDASTLTRSQSRRRTRDKKSTVAEIFPAPSVGKSPKECNTNGNSILLSMKLYSFFRSINGPIFDSFQCDDFISKKYTFCSGYALCGLVNAIQETRIF